MGMSHFPVFRTRFISTFTLGFFRFTHLFEVFAVFFAERGFVFCNKLFFLFGIVDPKAAGTNKVGTCSAFGTGADDFVVELFCLSPRSDAFEAEAVIAVRKNSKSLFTTVFFPYNIEADSARFLL